MVVGGEKYASNIEKEAGKDHGKIVDKEHGESCCIQPQGKPRNRQMPGMTARQDGSRLKEKGMR